ncbi:hypothetical protein AB0G29_18895 [Streptomyces parvus]|uniref:hypothetical protein n=1 Tax=Streptomyces parvus TaxID=66428 RepID=UPI0033DE7417
MGTSFLPQQRGVGIYLRNLAAEYEEKNTPSLNHGVEKKNRNAINSGKRLAISVISERPTGGFTTGSSGCPRR